MVAPDNSPAAPPRPLKKKKRRPKRSAAPQPFPPKAALEVGDVVTLTMGALRANAGSFLPWTLICLLPSTAVNILVTPRYVIDRVPSDPKAAMEASFSMFGVALLGAGVGLVCNGAVAAGIAYGTREHLAGRRPSFNDLVNKGSGRVWHAIWASLFSGVLIGLAFCACLVPGPFVFAMLAVSVPAAVLERRGPIAALERSSALTRGSRVYVFLILFGILLVTVVMGYVGNQITRSLHAEPGSALQLWASLPGALIGIFWSCFHMIAATVIYARLRGMRGDPRSDAVAEVFS